MTKLNFGDVKSEFFNFASKNNIQSSNVGQFNSFLAIFADTDKKIKEFNDDPSNVGLMLGHNPFSVVDDDTF